MLGLADVEGRKVDTALRLRYLGLLLRGQRWQVGLINVLFAVWRCDASRDNFWNLSNETVLIVLEHRSLSLIEEVWKLG